LSHWNIEVAVHAYYADLVVVARHIDETSDTSSLAEYDIEIRPSHHSLSASHKASRFVASS
jgi:hypothetical protein